MKIHTLSRWSVLVSFMILIFSAKNCFATEASLQQQEAVLEHELSLATSSEQISKITIALAQIKKQQSNHELKKLPNMLGRDRSFLTASVKDSLSYRQMASSFKNKPGNSSIAYSYHMGHLLGLLCILFGFLGLIARSKYRY